MRLGCLRVDAKKLGYNIKEDAVAKWGNEGVKIEKGRDEGWGA